MGDGDFSFVDTHMEASLQMRLRTARWWDEAACNDVVAKDRLRSGGLANNLKLRQLFHEWDRDSNGRFDKAEMFAALHALDPQVFSADNFDAVFEAADADGNGEISVDEFLDWLTE